MKESFWFHNGRTVLTNSSQQHTHTYPHVDKNSETDLPTPHNSTHTSSRSNQFRYLSPSIYFIKFRLFNYLHIASLSCVWHVRLCHQTVQTYQSSRNASHNSEWNLRFTPCYNSQENLRFIAAKTNSNTFNDSFCRKYLPLHLISIPLVRNWFNCQLKYMYNYFITRNLSTSWHEADHSGSPIM
jgi:hypothetical protein